MSKLSIIFNGTPELEYDRDKSLQDHQLLYLDKMDEQMDRGITIGDMRVNSPDNNQRAQFVAANLAHAIKSNQEPAMASLCSYLAIRLPDVQQVIIDERDNGIEIEFNFDPVDENVVLVAAPKKLN